MTIEHSIPRKNNLADPNGFAALRKEGIRTIQEMCGDVWTDYNIHDPGVTILEQICFGLTDLIYRSNFPVEDQLTGDDGKIAYDDQGLHLAEHILPCRPSTTADYRQVILDGSPDIDNVWLDARTLADSPDIDNVCLDAGTIADSPDTCAGVYMVTVRLASEVTEADTGAALTAVRQTFVAHRNLCEDISETIHVAENIDCLLCSTIDIDGAQDARDLLARIYRFAASHIAASVRIKPFQDREERETLADVLNGPIGSHGRIEINDGGDDKILIADLLRGLQEIDGVIRIQNLSITVMHPDGARSYSESVPRRQDGKTLRLRVPRPGSGDSGSAQEQHSVRLLRRGKIIETPVAGTWSKYQQLRYADKSNRAQQSDPGLLYELPQGEKRDFSRYFSIQNDFPNAYGINASGVPAAATPANRARARQLKAYLILFEQIMANHAVNVNSVRDLFSTSNGSGPTYRYKVLDNATIADAEQLYRSSPAEFLKKVIRKFDNVAERKSRQFDYMLAVFGEGFAQKSLRHFDYYSSPEDPHTTIADNKVEYLRNIVEATRDRTGGLDYLSADSVCGFARRVGLRLGFRNHGGSLTAAIHQFGVDPDAKAPSPPSPPSPKPADKGADERPRDVPPIALDPPSNGEIENWKNEARNILKNSGQGRILLVEGVDIGNYRLADGPDKRVALELGTSDGKLWHSLETFVDEEKAITVANVLQKYVTQICRSSEGLHVVEHVLLRPAADATTHAGEEPRLNSRQLWQDFYALRFSVLFPDWTARCRDTNFRMLAEETVRINSPAHVYGQCHWLNYEQMSKFERLLGNWTNARLRTDIAPAQVDDCAVGLIDFVTSLPDDMRLND